MQYNKKKYNGRARKKYRKWMKEQYNNENGNNYLSYYSLNLIEFLIRYDVDLIIFLFMGSYVMRAHTSHT